MNSAKIIDNIPYCGKCGNRLGNTREYKHIIKEDTGESFTLFSRYCDTKGCGEVCSYLLDLSLEGNIRYELNNEKIKEVEEEE